MSWKIKWHETKPQYPDIGDAWPEPQRRGRTYTRTNGKVQQVLSPKYYEGHAGRRDPIVVCMPDGRTFCVDSRACTHEKDYYGDGWTVQGDAPNITLTPSINLEGSYHGYIQNGIITDDCEGRKYDEQGRIVG